MRKSWFLVGIIFLSLPWALLGCGVAQERYDAMATDLSKAQQELQSVKAELATAQKENSELTSRLGETKTEPAPAQPDVEAIRNELQSTKAELETAKISLAESIKNISSIRTDLQKANDDIKTQQQVSAALSEQLKKVKYARHFESLEELTEWVQKDDTDTAYPDASDMELAYVLQVRAAGDGYILPIYMQFMGEEVRVLYNLAVIGEYIYSVGATDDLVGPYLFAQLRLPLHPILAD